MTSFNSIALNGSTLSVNGTDYNLSLSQTAEGTDSSLSSFKGVAAVDNGDGTISLTVGENTVVCEKYETVVMPTKGDLISMTLGNATPAAGTNNTYRVLSVNGTQAEVVAMFDQVTSQAFGSNNTYVGSDLDTYFTTWYNNLSADAKSAIVAKTFTQDSWYWGTSGNPDYNGTYWTSSNPAKAYQVSLGSTTYGTEITRNVYALSVQDIIDYLGVTSSMTTANTTLTAANIWTLFWNTTSAPGKPTYPWLRSARADNSNYAFHVYGNYGHVYSNSVVNVCAARPAFTIDLSKIEWSKV